VIGRYRALIELGLALFALAAASVTWAHARHTVTVGPIADGQPVTTSLVYHPQVLLVTLMLITIGGVLEVVGVARLWRQRSASNL
jgi:high-affinity K+ transport system ATPase subunit B